MRGQQLAETGQRWAKINEPTRIFGADKFRVRSS